MRRLIAWAVLGVTAVWGIGAVAYLAITSWPAVAFAFGVVLVVVALVWAVSVVAPE